MKNGIVNKLKQYVWRIVFVLFSLVFVTSHFSVRYAARFTTQGSGGDSARVASFSFTVNSPLVSYSGTLAMPNMKPGDKQTYSVYIANNSEVVLTCVISVTNVTNNLPFLQWGIEESDVTIPINGSKYFTFYVEWPKTADSPEYMGLTDILQLTVSVEQVD